MKFILGKKQGMIQVFDSKGQAISATVVDTTPMVVTQVKTKATDGYEAVQFGMGTRKSKNVSKAVKGHVGKAVADKADSFSAIRENAGGADLTLGQTVDVSIFSEGDNVVVTGISKGKGFQGVVKRHGFKGGRRSHGQKHSEREPGSIGATGPQRVFKGVRMAGRMGSDRVSVKNLQVVRIDKDNGQLLIKGAVPGRRGTLLEIRSI
jgi:large subunit ribosomal protein L3